MTSIENFLNISISNKEELKQISKKIDEIVLQKTINLKESEFKYRTIFNASPDIIYVTDYHGNILDVNQAWMNKIGVKREDIDKINITDFYVGNNPADLEKNIQEIRNGKEIKGFEAKAKNIAGELFDFEINSLPIEKDGRILMVINIARDITKRKEMERKLRLSEGNYRLISESANDLIRVMNDDFEFEYINEKVHKRLLGYSKEDMLGKLSLVFIHPQDRRAVIRSTRDYLQGGMRSYEVRFRSKSGEHKWFEVKAKVFHDERGEMKVLSIARDINDRKLAETERKLNEQKTVKSERKFRLLFNQLSYYKDLFAHNINNVLQVIRTSTELLSIQLSEKESKGTEEVINIINKQIDRGAKLMSSAFTLSELEESEISIRTLKLCDLLRDSIEHVKKVYEERNVVIKEQCDNINLEINLKANPLIQDIIDNLLINAIMYNTSPQVEIIITGSSVVIDGINYLKIEFKDNGIGIPDEKKKFVFEGGNKNSKGSGGMGLGFSIVKKILDSYQGKIWVENRVKGDFTKGTNFVLLLQEIE